MAAASARADEQAALVRCAGFALGWPGWGGMLHATVAAALRLRASRLLQRMADYLDRVS